MMLMSASLHVVGVQRRQDTRHNYVTRLHTFLHSNTSILALAPFTQVY